MPRRKNLFDTGVPVPTADGGWVLNPDSTFPLVVYGVDAAIVKKLKRGLEKGYALSRDAEEAVFPIVSHAPQFRWRELEAYEREFVAPYVAAVREVQQRSAEWNDLVAKGESAANRRSRLLASFQESIAREWGEAFRYAPGLIAEDQHERRLATVELFVTTYLDAGHAAHRRTQHLDPDLLVSVDGWSIERPPRGCCHICRAMATDYPKDRRPNVPVHVGCPCTIDARLRVT